MEVNGITVHNREHRLSQYADDTSVFLSASERNLKAALKILHWFHQKPGLKININKTKVIRIGPIRETDHRFCRENDLEWVHVFVALGIEYNVLDLQGITELNINNKIESMNELMHVWISRNISPIGRVTIFKSLILSKIIHVLQTLPSPKTEYFDNIEQMAINFIWKNKCNQVNKKILSYPFQNGGLDMINIHEFDKSLKISWVYKTLCADPDWLDFAKFEKIDRLPWTGETYHSILLENAKSPFWVDVISSYKKWYSIAKPTLVTNIQFEPLWGNPAIPIPFNKILFDNNFLFLTDLYDELNEPLSKA